MSSQSRLWVTAGLAASSVALIVGLSSLSGCNPHKDQLRPESLFGRIGRQAGQVIEPKKCMLRVAILNRPFRDAAINETIWKVADEQAIALEVRRALEVNGLRIGQITGELPAELQTILDAPPPHKVEPASFLLGDGEQTLISTCDPVDLVSLLLNRENRPYGKDYQAASGYFRVTATHEGSDGIALRFTPEIHHGPIQRSYQPLTHATPYAPQQFRINDGQQEEALGDLAANLVLEPGQVAVIGCRPEQERSLGAFLFTPTENHGDQKRQKLVLLWASRNQLGVVGDKQAKTDRPVPTRDTRKPADEGNKSVQVSSRGKTADDKGPPGSTKDTR